MRALVFRAPWDIGVESRDQPAPGPGEVAVRIVATGICGSDIHGFTGENGRRHPGQIMGHETVGTVEALGPGVAEAHRDDTAENHGDGTAETHGDSTAADHAVGTAAGLPIGAVVTVNPLISCGDCPACQAGAPQSCPRRRIIGVDPTYVSAFAEVMLVPAGNVVRLPDDMPIEYGALIEPLSVGRHAAGRGGCTAGEAVVVIGGGPIGQACALAAARLGARHVVVSEPSPSRRRLIEALGFTAVDPTGQDLAQATLDAFGGPANLVLDTVGTSRSLADAVACSSFGARVVLVGMNAPQIELAAYMFSTEERSLIGSFCYTPAEFAETAAWVGSAPAELAALIDGRVDFDGAPAAFASLARRELDASKVLVFPQGVPASLPAKEAAR
jgi:threonine dehydrogenase-like Zn-dependent dehydrogenase